MLGDELKHIAIIMDGNGRWAKLRHRPRIWGHIRGASRVADIIEAASDCNVKALTLYAFSTENWSRPSDEIRTIFLLLKKYLRKEKKRIIENKIRFKVIGKTLGLPEATIDIIKELEYFSRNHNGLRLTFAFGYGGRAEILNSVNKFISRYPGKLIDQGDLEKNLYSPDMYDVDLLIRTGGDQRVSNFLLWKIAYAELYFTKTKWPDFTSKEFKTILEEVWSRKRRFGAMSEGLTLDKVTQMASRQRDVFVDVSGTSL